MFDDKVHNDSKIIMNYEVDHNVWKKKFLFEARGRENYLRN